MARSRGHALAARRARDGSARRRSTILSLQCRHRSPNHQNTPRQHLSIPTEKGIVLTRNPRTSARPSTSTSLPRGAHRRRSCIRTRSTSPERVLWNWTTARDGDPPTRSHGPSPWHAPSDHALGWDDEDDAYTSFLEFSPSLFFSLSFFFHLWFSVTNCIAPVGGISWFVGTVNRIDDFYPSVLVAFFSFVCGNFGGTSKCELMCFSYDSEAGSRSAYHILKRHEPFWGLRSPTSYLSHTRILAHDRQHCRCHARARLPRTGGSSDGKSGVDHPYEPKEPFDLAHRPCPNLDGCSFARGPRRRSGSSHPLASLNHASQFAESRLQLGLAAPEWRDGALPRLRSQSQRLHSGVGGQGYRPPRSNVAGAAEQSEPGFQICHRVSPDQVKRDTMDGQNGIPRK